MTNGPVSVSNCCQTPDRPPLRLSHWLPHILLRQPLRPGQPPGACRRRPELVLAHRLASALIKYQTASGGLAKTLRALSDDLAAFAPDPSPVPARFAEWFARLPIARAVGLFRPTMAFP